MIFADKVIKLRKKHGWSQEELAELLNVSRQAVSKWEGAQSIPDLEKIVTLSKLFGVSTDFLLKDDIEEYSDIDESINMEKTKYVSIEEMNCFLLAKEETSKTISLATFLCMLSPIGLLILAAMSENPQYNLSESMAAGIGMIVMIPFIIVAVVLFVISGSKTAQYEYLGKEVIETQEGIKEIVKEKQKEYQTTHNRFNIIAIILCIISIIPLFIAIVINENDDVLLVSMISLLLMISGMGVYLFIRTGIIWASYEKILQVGDYTIEKKRTAPVTELFGWIYWLMIVAIFLGHGFMTSNWTFNWVILVIGGILFPAFLAVVKLFQIKSNTSN